MSVLGNGDGTFRAAKDYNANSGPVQAVVYDLNSDNKLDIVVTHYRLPFLCYWVNGYSTF
ncbi:FG-GAP repeat domain-containing protein [Candidatus Midichloria mitochondrii]|uniref:FG-GAP repeat domain-containing protein n=1 Tax=Candidatus Midichloria mitochondrii TaxID=234827 RepID=UPI0039778979